MLTINIDPDECSRKHHVINQIIADIIISVKDNLVILKHNLWNRNFLFFQYTY